MEAVVGGGEVKDITSAMLTDATLGDDIAKFKERCLANPLVRDCEVTINRVNGRRREDTGFDVEISAEMTVQTKMMVKVRIAGTGVGAINRESRELVVKKVTIDNDMGGLLTKLLSISGYVEGARIRVAKKDIAVLDRELA